MESPTTFIQSPSKAPGASLYPRRPPAEALSQSMMVDSSSTSKPSGTCTMELSLVPFSAGSDHDTSRLQMVPYTGGDRVDPSECKIKSESSSCDTANGGTGKFPLYKGSTSLGTTAASGPFYRPTAPFYSPTAPSYQRFSPSPEENCPTSPFIWPPEFLLSPEPNDRPSHDCRWTAPCGPRHSSSDRTWEEHYELAFPMIAELTI
jgi:hypothetical protein